MWCVDVAVTQGSTTAKQVELVSGMSSHQVKDLGQVTGGAGGRFQYKDSAWKVVQAI